MFALLMVAINIVSAITPFRLSNYYYISDDCTYNSDYYWGELAGTIEYCAKRCQKNYNSEEGDCTHFQFYLSPSGSSFCRLFNDLPNNELVIASSPPPGSALFTKYSCGLMKGRIESSAETRLINRIPAGNSVQHWNFDPSQDNMYWTVGCSFQAALMQSAKIKTIPVAKMEDCKTRCSEYQDEVNYTWPCTHFYVSKSGNVFNCDLLRIPSGTDNIIFDKSKTTQHCGFLKNTGNERSKQSTKF